MPLSTSRYQRFHPDQGVAVRTTVGRPRFRLDYPLAGHATLISPMVWMLRIADEQHYRTAYTDMLATTGLDAIRHELTTIATAAGNDRLVLLCFCDLTIPAPNNWCHRRIFADWWQTQTGDEIPELAPAADTPEQPLF